MHLKFVCDDGTLLYLKQMLLKFYVILHFIEITTNLILSVIRVKISGVISLSYSIKDLTK